EAVVNGKWTAGRVMLRLLGIDGRSRLAALGRRHSVSSIPLLPLSCKVPLPNTIFYLFLGNAELRLRHLDEARAAYDHVLNVSPQYARSFLGRGQVAFQKARGACEPGDVDIQDLE